MDRNTTALVVSAASLLISGLSLGWNIYREIALKARLRVSFQVSTMVHPALPTQRYLDLSIVNHGPGRVTCDIIVVKTSSLWRKLRRTVSHGVILGDWTNPLSAKLPKTLEIGERMTLLLPYEKRCFL